MMNDRPLSKRMLEAVALYGVQCSETKELAPAKLFAGMFDELEKLEADLAAANKTISGIPQLCRGYEAENAELRERLVTTVLSGFDELGNIRPVQLDVNGHVILCDRQFNVLMGAIGQPAPQEQKPKCQE